MPASPARAAAFDILLRVERESSYASELLHSAACARLSASDRALLTELVMGVLRWRSWLDDSISSASSQPLSKLDLEVLIALRLALYQLTSLDRVPHRAAINESVELVKRARKRSAAPFVNAILRKLAVKVPIRPVVCGEGITSAATLARASAHPLWLVERWVQQYGLEVACQICQYNQSVPATTIRLRSSVCEAALRAEGIELTPGTLLASARHVQSGDVTKTKTFRSGQVVIQDEASQLVAALVGRGSRILDCCAAPGGKTLALADITPDAKITAIELHPHRARLLQNLLQSKVSNPDSSNIQVVNADVRDLQPGGNFDCILADVPCSGTGTLARNPEIKWRLRSKDLADLQSRQRAILRSAMQQVAPGGRLVYSTCSLENEENEDVVEAVLPESNYFRLLDCRDELGHLKAKGEVIHPNPDTLTRGPYLRTLPGIQPCDGFFAAILQKAPITSQ